MAMVAMSSRPAVYSPTSAAESGSAPPTPGDLFPIGVKQDALQPFANKPEAYLGTEDVIASGEPKPAVGAGTCPLLIVGTKLDKELHLKADRWIVVGRDKHCQLLLNNHSVSRNHCSFRWDPRQRKVELKDTSATGTRVNGNMLRGERQTLQHGDHVCVEGRGVRYDLILDMRPVAGGAVLGDPRTKPREVTKQAPVAPPAQVARRREQLRTALLETDRELREKEGQLFSMEKEYYEVQTRRRLREMEDQDRTERLERTLKSTEELEQKLKDTREAWSSKLRDTLDANIETTVPLIKQAAEIQEKLEKLVVKKNEVEKEIHPERLALLPDLYGNSPHLEDQKGPPSVQSQSIGEADPAPFSEEETLQVVPAPAPEEGAIVPLAAGAPVDAAAAEADVDADSSEPSAKRQRLD